MKYYKTIVNENKNIIEKITNLNDFSNFSGIKQPYLHKVWKGDYVVSEKQYIRIKSLIEDYSKVKKPSKTARN